MGRFVETVIKEDAKYFYGYGYITETLYRRVKDRLNGGPDSDVDWVINRWLESDIKYIDVVHRAIAKDLWFFYPFIKIVSRIMMRILRKHTRKEDT